MRLSLIACLVPLVSFAAPQARAGGHHARVIASPTIGCTDRALLQRFSFGDQLEAYQRVALGAGECRTLDQGLIVVKENAEWFTGLVRVRPVGEPQGVWISRDALADGYVEWPVSAGTRFPQPWR